ncbi:hypothetical protein IMY05_003G0155200 [Salix suchowensis]|nr:hypothetical protein IMY05_003G0155200 [Salix suchowensis]
MQQRPLVEPPTRLNQPDTLQTKSDSLLNSTTNYRWKAFLLRNWAFKEKGDFQDDGGSLWCDSVEIESLIWTGSGRGDVTNFTRLDIVMAS